jgi:hypothetical protein
MRRPTLRQAAEIALGILVLIVIRALGEFFRLRYVLGDALTIAQVTPYIAGALFATVALGAGALCYLAGWYRVAIGLAAATVLALFAYKLAVIG